MSTNLIASVGVKLMVDKWQHCRLKVKFRRLLQHPLRILVMFNDCLCYVTIKIGRSQVRGKNFVTSHILCKISGHFKIYITRKFGTRLLTRNN